MEAFGHLLGAEVSYVVGQLPHGLGGQDGVVLAEVVGIEGVGSGDHLFVYLFAGADAHDGLGAVGAYGFGYVEDAIGGDFGDKQFAAPGGLQRVQYHIDALLQGDVEAGHVRIGDGQHALLPLFEKEGDDGAVGAHDVAVAHHRKDDGVVAFDVVGSDKQFVGGQLGGAVQVDGRTGFVGRQRYDPRDAGLQGSIDDVFGAADVGFDALVGIVLSDVHVFHGCCMDDVVHAVECALEALAVAHISDEVADGRVVIHGVFERHLVLLLLIPGEDDQFFHIGMVPEQVGGEGSAQGAGAAGDEY